MSYSYFSSLVLLACVSIFAAGCGNSSTDIDAGNTEDAGTEDAGTEDAGTEDAGTEDAGTEDAGTEDAGTEDAGTEDAGTEDAGTEDAGTEDAGTEDAGTEDAGTEDAGGGDTGLEIDFAEVPAGTYQVGSPLNEVGREGDDFPLHDVTLTHAFQIGITEVTQAFFEQVTGYNPSYTDETHFLCAECPVDSVTWHQAAEFTNLLSEAAGQSLCYTCTGEGLDLSCEPAGSPYECNGCRLPTEAEWEIAARAGTNAAFPNGGNLVAGTEYQLTGPVTLDNNELLDSFAWYRNNSGDHPHEVGTLDPNDFELYDVVGNLTEWCHDWYHANTGNDGAQEDPYGPPTGEYRINRGGSYNMGQPYLRLAYRNWYDPIDAYFVIGLRPARTIIP
ncbi:MAG: SUMF1/EgtB/PvdO family nonheme iron enzyme [Deltaproteobacteria bacterium]|nr:SUMF1/EgtB/PvdO family nonheme iron enzyme [Deltaproteobacteria bacterium]